MFQIALAIASFAELATGAAVFIAPSVLVKLLFGVEISGIGIVMSRIAGAGLIALGVACWPKPLSGKLPFKSAFAMGVYSLIASFYLGGLAFAGEFVGILLWPAVFIHAILTFLLFFGIIRAQNW